MGASRVDFGATVDGQALAYAERDVRAMGEVACHDDARLVAPLAIPKPDHALPKRRHFDIPPRIFHVRTRGEINFNFRLAIIFDFGNLQTRRNPLRWRVRAIVDYCSLSWTVSTNLCGIWNEKNVIRHEAI